MEILKLKDKLSWQKKLGELRDRKITCSTPENVQKENLKEERHGVETFNISCNCTECSEIRQILTMLSADEELYNEQLTEFQKMIETFYMEEIIPKNSPIFKKYQKIFAESDLRWYSDGNIDVKRNIQLSVGPVGTTEMNLPGIWKNLTGVSEALSLDNSDSFKIVPPSHYKLLYARDKHQLFELLCLQIRCVAMAYQDYLENNIRKDKQDDESTILLLLKAILDVYHKFCDVGKVLSRLFSDMEKEHLQNFSLSWLSINQFIFYKHIYSNFENFIPECIIKLKEDVELELYKQYVFKLINLDEELTTLAKNYCRVTYPALYDEKRREDEMLRAKTMQIINELFVKINKLDVNVEVTEQKAILDWLICSSDESVWQNVLQFIKTKRVTHENVDCLIHDSNPEADCQCRQCLVFYNLSAITSPQTTTLKKNKSSDENGDNNEIYHLSWALFKHHEDRKCYNDTTIQPDLFCVFQKNCCTEKKCSVAISILIGVYPVQFSKYLLKSYIPLNDAKREKILKVPELELRKVFECKPDDVMLDERDVGDFSEAHLFAMKNMTWDGEDRNERLLASALAENYGVNAKFPHTKIFFSYFNTIFKLDQKSKDIVFDLDWLEQITKSTLLKKFLLRSIEISWIENGDKAIEEIEKKIKFLSLSSDDTAVKDPKDLKMLEDLDKSIGLIRKTTVTIKKEGDKIKRQVVTDTSILKEMVSEMEIMSKVTSEKTNGTEKSKCEPKCEHKHEKSNGSSNGNGNNGNQGQSCVCHYCTFFEKNDPSSRNIEMRTRLRKRLQQQQQQLMQEQKSNVMKEKTKCNSAECKAPAHHPAPRRMSEGNPVPDNKRNLNSVPSVASNKSQTTGIIQKTEHNVKPIDKLIKYIEGDANEEQAQKKAKKPKKNKPKRNNAVQLEEKKMELDVLNTKLHNTEIQIKQYLNQLMQIRRGKHKDESRIRPVEEKLQEESALKSKYSVEATQVYNQVKQMDSTFDLDSYEPKLKYVALVLKDGANKEQKVPIVQETTAQATAGDTGKRMVTIRRINLPDSQPQVTVTAKGATPDKDQLLYAFVNGHLVPGAMIASNKKPSPSVPQMQQQQQPVSKVPDPKLKRAQEKQPVTVNDVKNFQQKNVKAVEPQTKKNQKEQKPISNQQETVENSKKKDKKNNKNKGNKEEEIDSKNNKKNKAKAAVTTNSRKSETRESTESLEIPPIQKRKVSEDYIDPEFDNNAFKLLNIDSDSDTESIEEVPVAKPKVKETVTKSNNEKCNKKKKEKDATVNNNNKNNNKQQQQQQQQQPKKVSKEEKPTETVKANINTNKTLKNVPKQIPKQTMPNFATNRPPPEIMGVNRSNINMYQQRPKFVKDSNLSITDQLNKGINPETLQLPPGITITKIDHSSMEALRAKQNSINNITFPMSDRVHVEPRQMGFQQNPYMAQAAPFVTADPMDANKKNKKKKNKKKKGKADEGFGVIGNEYASNKSDMITLKNPMFNHDAPGLPGMFDQPSFGFPPPPPRSDQPASITRNDNGMYTIRNPAFQNSFFRMNENNFDVRPPPPMASEPMRPMPSNSYYSQPPPPLPPQQPPSMMFGGNQDFKYQPDTFGLGDFRMDTECAPPPKRYDDLSFLETLQPGQHLNSEVTIHNINESKYLKKNDQSQYYDRNGQFFDDDIQPKVSFTPNIGSYRHQTENVFAPNQTVNLSELESEERDIESFKRFDYYFNPPKNKPKVNINVKDIVVHPKKTIAPIGEPWINH